MFIRKKQENSVNFSEGVEDKIGFIGERPISRPQGAYRIPQEYIECRKAHIESRRDISTTLVFVDIHPSGVRYTAHAVRYAAFAPRYAPYGGERAFGPTNSNLKPP